VHSGADGLRATYGFCLLDHPDADADDDLASFTVVGHIARGDPQAKDLEANAPALLLFEGPHGYVSASWYAPDLTTVPSTWDYTAVHLYGVPEVLHGDEGFDVVRRTIEHHEAAIDGPTRFRLDGERADFARKLYPGTVPFRMTPTRLEAKVKLNQDYPPSVVERVIENLETPGPYQNLALAADMRRLARRNADAAGGP
jgi:transcriptional regulator